MTRPNTAPPLTRTFEPHIEAAVTETPSGMAFWAGTGPAGSSCHACAYFAPSDKAKTKGTCSLYRDMVRKTGGKIPFMTRACKYFVERPA